MFELIIAAPGKATYYFSVNEYYQKTLYANLDAICPYDCINGDSFSFVYPCANGRDVTFEFDVDYYDEVMSTILGVCSAWTFEAA